MRDDAKSFEFAIPESGKYNVAVVYRHLYGIPIGEIPLSVTFEKKGNRAEAFEHILKLTDDTGNATSDCTGDICDMESVLLSRQLEPGEYIVRLSHRFDNEYLPHTPSVGIKVTKSDQ